MTNEIENRRSDGPAGRLRGKAEEAGEAAKQKAEDLKQDARRIAEDALGKAQDAAEARKDRAGHQVAELARALHVAVGELEEGSTPRQLLDQAAGGLDDVAAAVEGKSLGELMALLSDFGRNNPTAFIGGAALAGFALSRFATAVPEDDAPDNGSLRPAAPARPQPPAAGTASVPPQAGEGDLR
ncbi:MAG: hypothetical protein Kilf2KO_15090 [Rhodospirillales bacterium]